MCLSVKQRGWGLGNVLKVPELQEFGPDLRSPESTQCCVDVVIVQPPRGSSSFPEKAASQARLAFSADSGPD